MASWTSWASDLEGRLRAEVQSLADKAKSEVIGIKNRLAIAEVNDAQTTGLVEALTAHVKALDLRVTALEHVAILEARQRGPSITALEGLQASVGQLERRVGALEEHLHVPQRPASTEPASVSTSSSQLPRPPQAPPPPAPPPPNGIGNVLPAILPGQPGAVDSGQQRFSAPSTGLVDYKSQEGVVLVDRVRKPSSRPLLPESRMCRHRRPEWFVHPLEGRHSSFKSARDILEDDPWNGCSNLL